MANRQYRNQFRYSFEAKPVDLFMRVSFGAAGAPTLDSANSVGVKSISRNGAGDYTITLQDNYNKLRMVKHLFDTSGAAGAEPAAPAMYLKAQSVASAGTLRVVFSSAGGVATDPANGEAVLMSVALNDSNLTL